MRSFLAALVALPVLALQPTVAEASGCYRGPFAPVQLPAGCPVTVYQEPTSAPPVVQAMRDGALVDVTATVTKEPSTSLDVGHPEYDCDGEIESITLYPTPYDVYTLTVTDAIVGEDLLVGGWPVRVLPAAECFVLEKPEPLCGYIPDRCEGEEPGGASDNSGCNAGGGSAGAGIALLALALALRARR